MTAHLQTFVASPTRVDASSGYLAAACRQGLTVFRAKDLTVVAVEDGKLAAHSIDRHLRAVSKVEARDG